MTKLQQAKKTVNDSMARYAHEKKLRKRDKRILQEIVTPLQLMYVRNQPITEEAAAVLLDIFAALMIRRSRSIELTDIEQQYVNKWMLQYTDYRHLQDAFADPEKMKELLAIPNEPAPMKEIWGDINKYLDEIGAPDDREVKEWYDENNPMPAKVWLRVRFRRLLRKVGILRNRCSMPI